MSEHHDDHDHDDDHGDDHDDDEQRANRFVRVADRVSYAMGTWQNIVVWIILVGAWFAFGPYLANHSVLPAWFTSNNFNFPLNTVTTIAELYIGFLVGASTNRTERHNRPQADRMEKLEKLIHKELKRNTAITDNAQTIAQELKAQVPLLERTHADVSRLLSAMSPAAVSEG
jgi:low affinity Fe/Cu permease